MLDTSTYCTSLVPFRGLRAWLSEWIWLEDSGLVWDLYLSLLYGLDSRIFCHGGQDYYTRCENLNFLFHLKNQLYMKKAWVSQWIWLQNLFIVTYSIFRLESETKFSKFSHCARVILTLLFCQSSCSHFHCTFRKEKNESVLRLQGKKIVLDLN